MLVSSTRLEIPVIEGNAGFHLMVSRAKSRNDWDMLVMMPSRILSEQKMYSVELISS